ncbi:MAG: PorT family protein [Prevotella sp.]|nr:PorT family protein [Prevotella sp.]
MLNKKIKLTFLALFLLASGAHAQIGEHRNDLAIGVNGGYVLSNIGFTPKVNQGMHTGFTGGISARYVSEKYFSTICSIYAELNYANIGWKEDIKNMDGSAFIDKTTGNPQEYTRSLTYIQLPVFAHLAWGREVKGCNFFLNLGPQFGFLMSESTKTNFTVTPDYEKNGYAEGRAFKHVAQDTMKVENKFDYGIAAGIGMEYSNSKLGHFLIEARYYYGLGNIYGDSKRDYFSKSNIGNIVLKATYLFDITRTKGTSRK